MSTLRVFGIRHHGPGSARSLLAALTDFAPDLLLIEGPPEADGLLELIGDPDLRPPVALLVYDPDVAARAVFYPFAEYSPEWQAARYALAQGIAVRFCDAPVASMAPFAETTDAAAADTAAEATDIEPEAPRGDPLRALAQAAGFDDTERFWEVLVEQRQDASELFQAIHELMSAARAADPESTSRRDLQREAHMRTLIRAESKAGRERIAVVCGAWHAPVLDPAEFTIKADAELTRGSSRRKLASSWVPWSYDRLHRASGYGAGVDSPAWYGCLWRSQSRAVDDFVVRAARCFRSAGLEIGPAHAIEAGRLAHALAALRALPQPGLAELMQALTTVYGDGDGRALALVRQQLVVGLEHGGVPDSVPTVPLLADLNRECKRLRLKQEAGERLLELDLREDGARARSALLHRLTLLGVSWGRIQGNPGGARGTFKEIWRLRWDPGYVVELIDRARHGNSVELAAATVLRERAASETDLAAQAELLQLALRADLGAALPAMLTRFDALAAATGDVPTLMQSLPPLVDLVRYGDVRGTDVGAAARVLDHLAERIAIGLPLAAVGIDDAAAATLRGALDACDAALARAGGDSADWCRALLQLADNSAGHALIAGRATRLLLDRGEFSVDETARRLGLALSPAVAVGEAQWIEGLLGGSGLVLLHQPELLLLIDQWLSALDGQRFSETLPLLRRAFAEFSQPERRQIGERLKAGGDSVAIARATELDPVRVALVVPSLQRLLGVAA
jgi:hypothetical protein